MASESVVPSGKLTVSETIFELPAGRCAAVGKTAGNHTLDLLQDRTCGYSPATRSVDHREKISQSCAACLGSSGPGTSPFLFALLALAHCNRHAACHGAEGVVTS